MHFFKTYIGLIFLPSRVKRRDEVIAKKENINTLDSKGEVLITILASLAQDESRSINENSTWGIRRQFERGKVR